MVDSFHWRLKLLQTLFTTLNLRLIPGKWVLNNDYSFTSSLLSPQQLPQGCTTVPSMGIPSPPSLPIQLNTLQPPHALRFLYLLFIFFFSSFLYLLCFLFIFFFVYLLGSVTADLFEGALSFNYSVIIIAVDWPTGHQEEGFEISTGSGILGGGEISAGVIHIEEKRGLIRWGD